MEFFFVFDVVFECFSEDDVCFGEIVVCCFFGGLMVEEIVEVFEVFLVMVKCGWCVVCMVFF